MTLLLTFVSPSHQNPAVNRQFGFGGCLEEDRKANQEGSGHLPWTTGTRITGVSGQTSAGVTSCTFSSKFIPISCKCNTLCFLSWLIKWLTLRGFALSSLSPSVFVFVSASHPVHLVEAQQHAFYLNHPSETFKETLAAYRHLFSLFIFMHVCGP